MDQHVDQMISHYSETVLGRSGYRSEGFAAVYDTHRPAPPGELLDVLSLLARTERPRLVVDLGSGTGLSTRVWADRAETVVGVEPTAEMRAQAEAQTDAANVRYLGAWAGATGLADASADIVTCSQSLHWMEPEPTFAEAARILRPGGVFAAYDYDWPPVVDWELETAFRAMMEAVGRFRVERSHPRSRFRKEDHLARMNASGRFRYTRGSAIAR